MSVITKCPVCQKGAIMFKDNNACECSQCRFQCHRGQLDQVDAAMGLARATAAFAANIPPMGYSSSREFDAVSDAEERVLEVFNA